MTDRGLSTAVDVAICLLLIGASIAALSSATPTATPGAPPPTPAAVVIASVTDTPDSDPGRTIAERLAELAVADARPTETATGPKAQLHATITNIPGHLHVIARWRPYPDAATKGQIAVGESPPPAATVTTARFTVTLPTTVTTARLHRRARTGGFAAIARIVATGIRAHLDPPCQGLTAVRGGTCTATERSRPTATSLTARIESILRARFDDPTAAADAVTVDTVTIIVRRWTP